MARETTDLDPVLTLGQTLHATPTSHLLILGAGISIAANIPSAWGVQKALIEQLARQEGEPPPTDHETWFVTRYRRPLRYQDLLKMVAPEKLERQRLLRQFFETESEEGTPVLGEPSVGHRAIARLVASGHIRLIITLNFDHLIERALIETGIQPTIVSSVEEFTGLPPVHLLSAVVVHLHGEYTKPDSLRNTDEELADYPKPVRRFLRRALSDYGVISVGWSATYDPGLRAAITRSAGRRFTSYWVDPYPLTQEADGLRTWLAAPLVVETADLALGRLADATAALGDRAAAHPLTVPVAVATAKRQLAGQTTAINLHDTIQIELERVRPVLARDLERREGTELTPAVRFARARERLRVPEALVATAAYWGGSETDDFWFGAIERLGRTPSQASDVDVGTTMSRLPATHLYTESPRVWWRLSIHEG